MHFIKFEFAKLIKNEIIEKIFLILNKQFKILQRNSVTICDGIYNKNIK